MKKFIAISTLVSASLIAQPAFAATKTENQQAATVITSTVSGAILAGPIGAFAGAWAGGWLSDKIDDAAKLQASEKKREQTEVRLQQLSASLQASREQLIASAQEQQRLTQQMLDAIQLESFFASGKAQLGESSQKKLRFLSDYLAKNPQLSIKLDGYADPRGSEAANLALSRKRVGHIADVLVDAGINPSQITQQYHGEGSSEFSNTAFALQRVVKISVYQNTQANTEIAQR